VDPQIEKVFDFAQSFDESIAYFVATIVDAEWKPGIIFSFDMFPLATIWKMMDAKGFTYTVNADSINKNVYFSFTKREDAEVMVLLKQKLQDASIQQRLIKLSEIMTDTYNRSRDQLVKHFEEDGWPSYQQGD